MLHRAYLLLSSLLDAFQPSHNYRSGCSVLVQISKALARDSGQREPHKRAKYHLKAMAWRQEIIFRGRLSNGNLSWRGWEWHSIGRMARLKGRKERLYDKE